MTAEIDADLFRIVYETVSSDPARYYLNGVCIEPGPAGLGAVLISTDGHRMIVAHDPKGHSDSRLIVKLPKYALAQCRTPAIFADRRRIQVDETARTAAIIQVEAFKKQGEEPKLKPLVIAHDVIIDGTFPEWRRVVPKATDAKPSDYFINPKYIRAWGAVGVEVAKIHGNSGSVRFSPTDGASPMVVRFSSAPEIFGVQMPMRADISGFLPDFMKGYEFKEAAE